MAKHDVKLMRIFKRYLNKPGDEVVIAGSAVKTGPLMKQKVFLHAQFHDGDSESAPYRIDKAIEWAERNMCVVLERKRRILNDGSEDAELVVDVEAIANAANAANAACNAVVQKALNATASNSNWKTEDFDVAAKKIKSKYKVITWVSHSPSGEERIDVAVRPNEDVNKVAQDVIRIFKGEGIDMKVAGSTPLHYLGGLPPKQKSATWFRLLPMNSSVHTTNAVVAKALNASRVARNGYVVLRTASGGTARVYEGEEVEYDGKSYKAAALGSPSMAEATLVDGAGNKIVVRMRDPRLKAKASNAVEARYATPVGG